MSRRSARFPRVRDLEDNVSEGIQVQSSRSVQGH